MPEMAVSGPGGELDLGDEGRLDPARVARLSSRHVDEWRSLPSVAIQLGDDLTSQPLAEPRAHLAGVNQLVPVVVADQERAERATRGGGAMPAAERPSRRFARVRASSFASQRPAAAARCRFLQTSK
jgi:hypothetical protein